MAIVQIPVFVDAPDFTETVRLDGVDYRLRFSWYERQGWWLASIWRMPTGTDALRPLATGVAVRPGQDLLRYADKQYCPPGRLVILDAYPDAGESALVRESLGTRLLPLYIEQSSMADFPTAAIVEIEPVSVVANP